MSASAALALALALATRTAAPEPKPIQAARMLIKGWHYVQAGEVTDPGNHWHTCVNCGRSIQHGPENNNDRAAHTCVCGTLNWEKSPKPLPMQPYCPPGAKH